MCEPGIDKSNTVIQSAIEQAKMKFNSFRSSPEPELRYICIQGSSEPELRYIFRVLQNQNSGIYIQGSPEPELRYIFRVL